MGDGVAEGVALSEVEGVHQIVVEEISNLKTPIILDMDKILATINQATEISSNNILSSIRTINNIRLRSSINLLCNTNLHQDPMSILHLVTFRLQFTLNLKFLNTGNKMDSLLETTNQHTDTRAMQTHRPENVHETKPSATRTEGIP